MPLIDSEKLNTEITDKYSIANNAFLQVAKDNPKDKIEAIIGDDKQPSTFYPQIKIQRWDNEVNFSARLINEEAAPVVSTLSDKIVWDGQKVAANFYDLTEDEGGYEFEVILKEKPKTNIVSFTIQTKGLDFFYQPEIEDSEVQSDVKLTPEELLAKKREIRPENVVGSYAVYASENKVNYVGGKEYKCGKVGHIYRPKIVDSAGTEVWGDLHIENGILSVTIPQDFLDKAVYPVIVDPTFGYTTAGASSGLSSIMALRATGAMGKGKSISVYSELQHPECKIKAALYVDSNNSLLTDGVTQEITNDTGTNWRTMDFISAPALGAVVYDIACAYKDYDYQNIAKVYYDSGGTSGQSGQYSTSYPSSWPSSMSFSNSTAKLSFYVTYTVLEQEGFAFGDDDGDESSHTIGTQDANISTSLGTKTIRTIINATGNPSSEFKLKYQKNGSGGYVDVPIGAIREVDVSSFEDSFESDIWISTKINDPSTDPVWTRITSGWYPTSSPKTGSYYAKFNSYNCPSGASARYKCDTTFSIPAGSFSANLTFWLYHNTSLSSASDRVQIQISTDGTSFSNVGSAVNRYDGSTGWKQHEIDLSAYIGQSNLYVGLLGISDCGYNIYVDDIVISYTSEVGNQVYVSASSNVASGGEATTARLTAPSGKTTSNFTTGRRWDDENGSDSIDIAEDCYTELEWVLTTQSPATTDDYFDFRVYNGDTPLDTYTVTPKWTITAEESGTEYTLDCSATSFSLTGKNTTFTRSRTLTASATAFSFTAINSILSYRRTLIASATAFAVTGINAIITSARHLTASATTFAITGVNALLTRNWNRALSVASFAVTEVNAILSHARTLTANATSFSVSAVNANISHVRTFIASATSFTVKGISASFHRNWNRVLSAAGFTVTSVNTGLSHIRTLTANAASFAVTGIPTVLAHARNLIASATSFDITGQNADLAYTEFAGTVYTLVCETTEFVGIGINAGLSHIRTLTADVTDFTVTGINALFYRNLQLSTATTNYQITGQNIELVYHSTKNPYSNKSNIYSNKSKPYNKYH